MSICIEIPSVKWDALRAQYADEKNARTEILIIYFSAEDENWERVSGNQMK